MLKKILFLIGIALLVLSCNKSQDQNSPTAPFEKNQEVEIKVVARSNNFNNFVHARSITGKYEDKQGSAVSDSVGFSWDWSTENEELIVEIENNTDVQYREIFTMSEQPINGIAKFKGKLPGNYTGSEKLHIIGGNKSDVVPSLSQYVDTKGNIFNNAMRFETIVNSINDLIVLEASWSAFRLAINPYPQPHQALSEEEATLKANVKSVTITGNWKDLSDTGEAIPYTYNYTMGQDSKGAVLKGIINENSSIVYYFILILNPGKYTDLTFTITYNLSKCTVEDDYDNSFSPIDSQDDTFVFHLNNVDMYPNVCYPTDPARCNIEFDIEQ